MRIPPRFQDVTFDGYRPQSRAQDEALGAVEGWLQELDSGPLLALVGATGTGKSHLLYAAARNLIATIEAMEPKDRTDRGVAYPFVAPWYSLSDELRYGRTDQTESGSREVSGSEVRSRLWGRKIVLIDEIRRTSGSEFDDTELAKFACHAYDNRIAVLITTNWSPLSEVMGPAAASRFAQVTITGPDGRRKGVAA